MTDAKVELAAVQFHRRYGEVGAPWESIVQAIAEALVPVRSAGTGALVARLSSAATNIEMARNSGCAEHLAGWEHQAVRAAITALAQSDAVMGEAMPSDATKRMAKTPGCEFVPHSTPTAPVQDDDAEFWMTLIEPITRAIVFEDCGNTADWQENANLGIAVMRKIRPLIEARLSPSTEEGVLRSALEPFAACVDQIDPSEDDEEWAKFRLLIKDYRRAAAALAGKSGEKE